MRKSARTVLDARGGWDTVLRLGVSLSEGKTARLPHSERLSCFRYLGNSSQFRRWGFECMMGLGRGTVPSGPKEFLVS